VDNNFFTISGHALNFFSFMLGMLFAATMFRAKALFYVVFYFIGVSIYFYLRSEGYV